MSRKLSILMPLLALAGAFSATTATLDGQGRAVPAYAITDLGTLGGRSSEAAALNLFGDVVGTADTPDGESHAFLYRDGTMVDLGTLPGGTSSAATAITDTGTIVGRSGINGFGPQFREGSQAFVWQDGRMRALGALYCPCSFNERYGTSRAFGINSAGRIVGDSLMRRHPMTHAFLWQPDTMSDLSTAAGAAWSSTAYGINEREEVVGEINRRAFLLRDRVVEDLGTLPGHDTSAARAVNRVGQVAGMSAAADGTPRAFLWEAGVMRELRPLPGDEGSEALAINVAGHVVGQSGNSDLSNSRAVLWQGGAAVDLNGAIPPGGWVLTRATGINDVRQIAGVGTYRGEPRAFLLTPR